MFISAQPSHAENTSSWQARGGKKAKNAALFWHLLTFPSLPISPQERKTLDSECLCVSVCAWTTVFFAPCVYSMSSPGWNAGRVQWNKLGAPAFSTALIHVQLHSSSNGEQSSRNKELLFPSAVCTYLCGRNRLLSLRVFPLILSSKLIPYGKLITDWLSSCPFNKSWISLRLCFERLLEAGPTTIRFLSNMCIPALSKTARVQSGLWEPQWTLQPLFVFSSFFWVTMGYVTIMKVTVKVKSLFNNIFFHCTVIRYNSLIAS